MVIYLFLVSEATIANFDGFVDKRPCVRKFYIFYANILSLNRNFNDANKKVMFELLIAEMEV